MAKNIGFKDFLTVDYAPGMPDLIKKNAKKRKSGDTETSAVGEAKNPVEEENLDEALTPSQRRLRARMMKRLAPRIELGRKRAERRFADPERLKARARKAARKAVFLKLTKEIPKDQLTYARRQEIEKRLDSPQMKKRIERMAVKLLPKVRKKEMDRKRGQQSAD